MCCVFCTICRILKFENLRNSTASDDPCSFANFKRHFWVNLSQVYSRTQEAQIGSDGVTWISLFYIGVYVPRIPVMPIVIELWPVVFKCGR